jgi:hypothetical protein
MWVLVLVRVLVRVGMQASPGLLVGWLRLNPHYSHSPHQHQHHHHHQRLQRLQQ